MHNVGVSHALLDICIDQSSVSRIRTIQATQLPTLSFDMTVVTHNSIFLVQFLAPILKVVTDLAQKGPLAFDEDEQVQTAAECAAVSLCDAVDLSSDVRT